MCGSTVGIPLILSGEKALNVTSKEEQGELICTIFFCSGIITMMQLTLGIRLPLIQGGSFSFLGPALQIASLDKFSNADWRIKMREIQGGILVASLFQVLLQTWPYFQNSFLSLLNILHYLLKSNQNTESQIK